MCVECGTDEPDPTSSYQRGQGRRTGVGSSTDSRYYVVELGWGTLVGSLASRRYAKHLGNEGSFPGLLASGFRGWSAWSGPW